MTTLRISEAARLLGVSDDTVRRHVANGVLAATTDDAGHRAIEGAVLAEFVRSQPGPPDDRAGGSARNRFVGLVTGLVVDDVMAQVEVHAGPHRIVSLVSAEAVRELDLHVGDVATAVVKATSVMIDTPKGIR
jgi:molybdopterin-binding protein